MKTIQRGGSGPTENELGIQNLPPGEPAALNTIRRTALTLAGLVLGSGLLGFLMLNRGHDWGDDFAAYIMQAQSLMAGHMHEYIRHSAFTIDNSPITLGLTTYPWGFPLLLAPVYAVFGLYPLGLKLVLTASYMAFLVALFLLARTRLTDAESLLLTAFMAFNGSLLHAQNQIFADLPFLVWSTFALWLIERDVNTPSPPPRRVATSVVIGVMIFLAAFTRFNGFLLFVPLAVAQFQEWRSTPRLTGQASRKLSLIAIPYVAFGICYALQAAVLPSKAGGLQHAFDTFSGQVLLLHALYYFLATGWPLQESGLGLVTYIVLFTFLVIRLAALRRRDAPMALYVLATLALYIMYPPLQGPRFIYPILPVFFLLAFQGIKDAIRRLRPEIQKGALTAIYLLWVCMAAVALGVSVAGARSNLAAHRDPPPGPFSPPAEAMFSFIRQGTPADSIIVFFKPRAMRLFTNRDSFLTTNCDDLPKGDYVAIMQDAGSYNQLSPSSVRACVSVTLQSVYERDNFSVYKISSAP